MSRFVVETALLRTKIPSRCKASRASWRWCEVRVLEDSSEGESVMDVRVGMGAIAGDGDAVGGFSFRRLECEEPIAKYELETEMSLTESGTLPCVNSVVLPWGRRIGY